MKTFKHNKSETKSSLNRRQLFQVIPALGMTSMLGPKYLFNQSSLSPVSKIKLALNAYSFNKPLRDGTMSVDELLEFLLGVFEFLLFY